MTSCLDDGPKDLSCLPDNRIHCSTGKILVGKQEFLSATEALLTYLQQFDRRTRTKQQQDAYDLLVARTKMSSHRSRSLENEVKDSLLAVRKKRMKRLLSRKKLEQLGLKKEVEDALSRSADLLVRLNDEDDVPVCISDIGSLSTDLLLTSNPLESSGRKLVYEEDHSQRHVYSYRTPRSRFRTVGSVALQHPVPTRPAMSRPSSADSAMPISSLRSYRRSASSNSAQTLQRSDPMDVGKRYRSRSASPVPVHLRHPNLLSSPVQSETSPRKSVPSWVDTLDVSLDDSVLSVAPVEVRAPSWVHDAARSDSTADSLLLNGMTELSINKSMQNKSNLTDSRPGLNFSDLATSELSKHSNRHSFHETERNGFSQGAHTPEKNTGYRRSKDTVSSPGYKVYSATSTSMEKRSDRVALDDSVQMTTSLDRYLERLEAETAELSPRRSRPKMAAVPKCSSMDSESRKSPGKCLPQSEITGASSILKDSNMNMTLPGEDHMSTPNHVHFSPKIVDISANRSPGTDVILDADRSWEVPLKTYKAPVYVDSHSHKQPPSPTLTGSDQPGSMEALKNMLFKLQAEESTAGTGSDVPATKPLTNPLDLPALRDYNFRAEPGGQSLEKALVHLSRLKSLVQTPPADSASTVTATSSLTATSALIDHLT